MRTIAALAVLLVLSGCSGGGCEGAEADCTSQVRLDGVVYNGYGTLPAEVTPIGDVERAECSDGCDARGSYFPDDPETEEAFAIEGHDPSEVVAVHWRKNRYTVYVVESMSDQETEELFAELRRG